MGVYIAATLLSLLALAAAEHLRKDGPGARFALARGLYLVIHRRRMLLALAAMPLILVSACRDVGLDTQLYRNVVQRIHSLKDVSEFYMEKGFGGLLLVASRLSPDPRSILALSAVLMTALVMWGILRHSVHPVLSLFIYVFFSGFFASMNILRQMLAVAVIFCATGPLCARQPWRYALAVALAASLHRSALIMAPLFFLARLRLRPAFLALLLLLTIGIMTRFREIATFITGLFPVYEYYFERAFIDKGAQSVNLILAAGLFAFLALALRRPLLARDPRNQVLINMALFSFLIALVGYKVWVFERIRYYTDMYYLLLFPQIVDVARGARQRNWMLLLLVALGIYYLFGLYHSDIHGVFPYRGIL